ncbi:hypothetical protein AXI59_07775 [Bacillus nakamurai]|nr:hypothetical protein AXI59_07775 [Bacillus nakamurai]
MQFHIKKPRAVTALGHHITHLFIDTQRIRLKNLNYFIKIKKYCITSAFHLSRKTIFSALTRSAGVYIIFDIEHSLQSKLTSFNMRSS